MVEAPNVRRKLFLSALLRLRICRAGSALALILAALYFSACRKKPYAEKKAPVSQHHSQRIAVLAAAEINRDSRVVTVDDLMSRDVEVRRRAMQALARIADPTARPALERGLSDEDGQVVAWAAFGLGRACEKDSDLAVAQLALRAASWFAAEQAPIAVDRFTIHPISAIADALGRCGTTLAETTLRTWLRLDKSLAQRAAVALGTIAGKQHRLENTTLVALLEVADSKDHSTTTALFPLTRLVAVEANVQKRLLSVATKALSSKTDAQRYGIRALPLAGENAAPVLERTLCENANYDPELRADAARGLSRLGDVGQQSLGHALVRLLPRGSAINPTWLTSSDFGPVAEILDSLNYGDAESRPFLENLAKINVHETNSAAVQRRLLILRCQAASILAGSTVTAPLLIACDPSKDGRQGALAMSRVLGRAPIRGHRAQLYDRLAHSPDLVVRESALRWLRSHPEVRESARILADALGAESPGVVATAAGIVAEHPERAQNLPQPSKVQSSSDDSHDHETSGRAPHPTPELLMALAQATHRTWQADAVDVRAQLADAVATLGALSEKPYLEELCQSKSGVLRKHAELALRHIGETKRKCAATKVVPASTAPQDNNDPVHLRFHSDIGALDLWLEPQIAPIAVARLVELAKGGYFDNMPVHRVVSGFVVQLGDKVGDGFGVAGREPLRDELAPLSFGAGDVGLALSGPDTGSSQFFVVLGPHPHLDGDYTRVGRVDAGWDRLVVGDVIQRVELLFQPK
jgi:cyclophilin family peptidyl-prolyl cis-trans isomerase